MVLCLPDGGTENHNKHIHEFLGRMTKYEITMLRALKDIRFSNSPVEAIHRTIKGCYLRGRKFDTIKSLMKFLEWAVHDYNEVRPHYKHRPRTPHEDYFDIPLSFDLKKRKANALKQRLQTNKCVACMQCKGMHFELLKKHLKEGTHELRYTEGTC